jgi:cytochrome c biogenesis protein CcdA
MALNEALCERYGVPLESRLTAPTIFVGDDYLIGQVINAESLEELIEKYSQEESGAPWKEIQEQGAGASIIERFRSFTLLTVLGAGLLDGVNPCAFTTIIFFVSYLALMGRKGREVLLVGASFTAAVFLTYLLVGLGVLGFLQSLGVIKIFSRIIYLLAALLCFLLVALSLYDFYKIRQGRIGDISLKLPQALQRRVHQTIRERRNLPGFISATFVTGFFVSLLELACTGQVYLPTIIFVTGVPELRGHAVAYLILYNLMFILPLVIIFLLTFYGTASKQLTLFFRAKAGTVKLLTALLFAILGVWLILALT